MKDEKDGWGDYTVLTCVESYDAEEKTSANEAKS